MKKIINGKRYDTCSASAIHTEDNKLTYNDARYFSETLYLKKSGEYFLYGQGGGLSKYASYMYGGSTSGEDIIPLTHDDAFMWATRNMSVDDIESFFGEVKE